MSIKAAQRLEQIKRQLNFSPSPMSLQAPKDIARERSSASFDIKALSYAWAGSKEEFERKQKAYSIILNDPKLVVQSPQNILEFSRDQMREFTMGQIYRMLELSQDINDKLLLKDIHEALSIYSPSYNMRMGVHDTLFRNVVQMLGDKQQCDEWLPHIDQHSIFGCFAMTELGHSSALKEIETTATFDTKTDEFILYSPTITSTKWWMGMAGQTATHAVVIAHTFSNNQHVGLNWFIVPLRDTAGTPFPSVRIGDLGHKVGHQGVDNGWIQFHQTRIPRKNMLTKWTRIDRHGHFTGSTHPAIMYATLIPERIGLVPMTCSLATQALTIAARYGVVRRQGHCQIMDHQSHYAKLIPAVSFMYMVQHALKTLYQQQEILMTAVEAHHMSEMHCVSAALKGMSGFHCTEILETCRRACGGHAYSAYNALGSLMNDLAVMTTGGGDNIVLLQQAARHLLQVFRSYPTLQHKSSTDYLRYAATLLNKKKWNVVDVHECIEHLHLIKEALETIIVKRLYRIQMMLDEGVAYEDLLLDLTKIAELHCASFLFSTNMDNSSRGLDGILKKLTAVWGLYTLQVYGDQGLLEEYLDAQQMRDIRQEFLKLCKEMRYEIIGLTDAFGLPDFILKAPLGKYDGDIYPAYFETVLKAPGSVDIPK